MEPSLYHFYLTYRYWLESNSIEGEPYSRKYGLCVALNTYCKKQRLPENTFDVELREQFKEAGLSQAFPFVDLARSRSDEVHAVAHLNPDRVGWIYNKTPDGIPEGFVTPRELLIGFCKTYSEWLDAGAPDQTPFNRIHGLCPSLRKYCTDRNVSNRAIGEVQILLRSEFLRYNLDPNYPFGDADYYDLEMVRGSMHTNIERISWVKARTYTLAVPPKPTLWKRIRNIFR